MRKGNAAIDRLLAKELDGPEKLKAALKARGWTIQGYAQHRSLWPEQVKHVLHGRRTYPHIRDMMAEDLGLSRKDVDHLLDGTPAAKAS